MTTYSHSKLATFEQCPLKFKFRYIDRLKPDIEQTIEGYLGTKVHKTLEWIYNEILNKRTEEITLDEIIKYYALSWNKDYDNKIKIVKQEFTAEDYFNRGIKFLIDYFTTNSPFKDNTLETETKFLLNLEDGNTIIGYIDRLVHNKETNIFEVHDYKTSATIKTQEELDKDRQLALYSLAIKDRFKEATEIYLVWHFLDFNQKLISKRTKQQLELLKQEITQLIKKIESTTSFFPCKTNLCEWCEFQSYCPVIQEEILSKNKEVQETL